MITAQGIDPGFQYCGIGAVSRDPATGGVVCRGVQLLETNRDKGKTVRAGMDDCRRMRELWEGIRAATAFLQPQVMGVESYETRQGKGDAELQRAATRMSQLGIPPSREAFAQKLLDDEIWARSWIEAMGATRKALQSPEASGIGLGHAAKTIGVLWIAATVAFEHSVPVYVYTPSMLKRSVGPLTASKAAVAEELYKRIEGLREAVAVVPKTYREHVTDASGHALMALLEYEKWSAAYRYDK